MRLLLGTGPGRSIRGALLGCRVERSITDDASLQAVPLLSTFYILLA